LRQEARDWRTGYFYQHLFQHPHIPRSEGVIDGDWKYIRWLDGAPGMEELYHLPEDRWECHNLAEKSEHSTRLAKYRAMREHYLATLA
jgi:arylsulfatase A-like enzyme